jgi:ATP adenylyltransferase
MAYIKGEKKPVEGCLFCNKVKAQNDEAELIVVRSKFVFVMLNLYPYNTGHLMVVPNQHVSTQEELPVEALTDLMVTTNHALAALRKVYNPPAFNLGANLGQAAGAGIAEHYHFHIVPRWPGDSNFISVVGETRVIPDTLESTWAHLKAAWEAK